MRTPSTTMRYDRARKNLDRHPNYVRAAYMASIEHAELPMSGPPGRTHSWGPSPVRAKRSRLRYRTGLPSDSA